MSLQKSVWIADIFVFSIFLVQKRHFLTKFNSSLEIEAASESAADFVENVNKSELSERYSAADNHATFDE